MAEEESTMRGATGLRRALVAAAALSAASCVHTVAIRPAPSYDAYAFEAMLPLGVALHVDGERLFQEARIAGPGHDGDGFCEGNRYPVDAREAFRESVIATLERLVEHVEPTPEPLDREAMEARGLDAVFLVRADSFAMGLDGGVFRDAEAIAELTLVVSAYTRDGLQLREAVYGSNVQQGGAGSCGALADVLAVAVEGAIESSMTELGELLVNAPALRSAP